MLDVHQAPFRIVRRVVQHWRQTAAADGAAAPRPRREIVINVSSISGTHGAVGPIGYSSAKAGMVGLTLSLARELGPMGVNVNAVAFDLVETRLAQETCGETAIDIAGRAHRVGLTAAGRADWHSPVPLRRGSWPEEAAGAVLLLRLPESDYISGQVVEVDGGLSI